MKHSKAWRTGRISYAECWKHQVWECNCERGARVCVCVRACVWACECMSEMGWGWERKSEKDFSLDELESVLEKSGE